MTPQADGTILRGACLAMARSLNRHVKPGSSWDQKARNGDPRPGDLFNEQADWADILAPAGWSLVKTDGQVCYWLRPGKTDHEWSASTGYLRDGSVPLLYVFSSSAAPFEPERSYTPFAAFTLLNHGGDYKAAARALAGQGYTARPAPAVNGNGHSNGSTPAQPRQEPPDEVFPDAVPWPGPISPLAYHGLAGQIVRAMEAETESDPVAILIQILVIFGNAIGRHAYWQVEGDKHYGNLFCCLVGETAKGRKGTSKGRAMQAFTAVEDDSWRGRFASGLSSGEGLIWAVRDPIYKRHQVKKDGRVIDHQDIEEDPGAPDKRLLVIESEFVGALRSAGRDGNTLSARIREAWDTGNLLSLTKNSQAKATGAHISIIGHITKAELSRAMSEVETTNGFANRFLWCAVRRSQMLPMGGKYVELGHLDDQIALLITHAQLAGEVPFDAGAEDLWCRELYPKLTAPAHGIAASVCNRAEAQVPPACPPLLPSGWHNPDRSPGASAGGPGRVGLLRAIRALDLWRQHGRPDRRPAPGRAPGRWRQGSDPDADPRPVWSERVQNAPRSGAGHARRRTPGKARKGLDRRAPNHKMDFYLRQKRPK